MTEVGLSKRACYFHAFSGCRNTGSASQHSFPYDLEANGSLTDSATDILDFAQNSGSSVSSPILLYTSSQNSVGNGKDALGRLFTDGFSHGPRLNIAARILYAWHSERGTAQHSYRFGFDLHQVSRGVLGVGQFGAFDVTEQEVSDLTEKRL